jgi:hypothetical protein
MLYQHIRQGDDDTIKLQIVTQNRASQQIETCGKKYIAGILFLTGLFVEQPGSMARLSSDGVLF